MAHQIVRSALGRGAHRNNGFTLVELLVVIAIMSLLIAVLLPALSRARAVSKSVVCMSNLRQWGLGILMYANDNEGVVPLINNGMVLGKDAGGGSVSFWSQWLNETKYVPGGAFAANGSAIFKSTGIGFCTESPYYGNIPQSPAPGWQSVWYSTYASNGLFNYRTPAGLGLNWVSSYVVVKSLNRPWNLMLVTEVQVPQGASVSLIYPDQNGASPQNQLAQYHPDKSNNGLFGDGHVENMTLKSFGGWTIDYNASPSKLPYPWRAD